MKIEGRLFREQTKAANENKKPFSQFITSASTQFGQRPEGIKIRPQLSIFSRPEENTEKCLWAHH